MDDLAVEGEVIHFLERSIFSLVVGMWWWCGCGAWNLFRAFNAMLLLCYMFCEIVENFDSNHKSKKKIIYVFEYKCFWKMGCGLIGLCKTTI